MPVGAVPGVVSPRTTPATASSICPRAACSPATGVACGSGGSSKPDDSAETGAPAAGTLASAVPGVVFPSDNAGDRKLDQFPGGLLAGDRAGCRRVIPKREDSGRIPRDRIPRNRSARDRIPRDRIVRGCTSVHRRGGWRRVREEVRVGHRWLPQGTRRCRVRVGRADEPVGEARPPLRQGPVTGTRTLHNPYDSRNTCSWHQGNIFAIPDDCRPHRPDIDPRGNYVGD